MGDALLGILDQIWPCLFLSIFVGLLLSSVAGLEPVFADFKTSFSVPVRTQLVVGPLQDHLPGVRRRQEGGPAKG